MTASSDTLRSPEPPSPAGPLSPSGRHPLVHTRRGLQSGLGSLARVCLFYTRPVPSHPAMPCHALPCPGWLHSPGATAWSSSSEDSATGCRPVVSVPCTMSAAPQLCVCVFIRGDSSAQWNKDAVNHNQMGVCAGGGGEGGEGIRGGWGRSLCVLNVQGDAKTQCGTLKAKGRGLGALRGGGVPHLGK